MIVLNSLAPLVLIVALGTILRRARFLDRPFFKATNRLTYWVGLPCLLFYKTSHAEATGGMALRIFLILLTATLVCVVFGYMAARALRVKRRSVGAFVQGAYRGNVAYVGLAMILFTVGDADKQLAGAAALALAPLIPVYNFIAVTVLLIGQDNQSERTIRRLGQVARRISSNPLLLACCAGLVFVLSGWPVPVLLSRTTAAIGRMALPLALLGIGANLAVSHFSGALIPAVASAAIKVACAPLIGLAAAAVIGASAEETRVALLYLACPTAVVSLVMAEQLGADEQLAGGIIILSTIASTVSLAAVLLLT